MSVQSCRARAWFAASLGGPGVQSSDGWKAGLGSPPALQIPVHNRQALEANRFSSFLLPPRFQRCCCQVRSLSWLDVSSKCWAVIGHITSSMFMFHRPGTLLDYRSQDLAEQLTLLDSQLFFRIEVYTILCLSHLYDCHLPVTCLPLLSSFQRYCCGPKSRMRRRVPTWQSLLNTSTMSPSGKKNKDKSTIFFCF